MWGGSDEGFDCQENKTFAQAEAICATAGARLCTVAELEDECTRGTGCFHDWDLVWGTGMPTPTASVVCGRADYCPSEAAGLRKVDELHEVCVCSTSIHIPSRALEC